MLKVKFVIVFRFMFGLVSSRMSLSTLSLMFGFMLRLVLRFVWRML